MNAIMEPQLQLSYIYLVYFDRNASKSSDRKVDCPEKSTIY